MNCGHYTKLGVGITDRVATLTLQSGEKFAKAAVNIPLRQAVESVLETSLALESLTLRSEDAKEGVAAFLARRKPVFKGK